MKRSELIELKKMVLKEQEKRKRIDQMQNNELIKEYLSIIGMTPKNIKLSNRDILKSILNSFD